MQVSICVHYNFDVRVVTIEIDTLLSSLCSLYNENCEDVMLLLEEPHTTKRLSPRHTLRHYSIYNGSKIVLVDRS